jgi:hypothetical protein
MHSSLESRPSTQAFYLKSAKNPVARYTIIRDADETGVASVDSMREPNTEQIENYSVKTVFSHVHVVFEELGFGERKD